MQAGTGRVEADPAARLGKPAGGGGASTWAEAAPAHVSRRRWPPALPSTRAGGGGSGRTGGETGLPLAGGAPRLRRNRAAPAHEAEPRRRSGWGRGRSVASTRAGTGPPPRRAPTPGPDRGLDLRRRARRLRSPTALTRAAAPPCRKR